VATAAVVVAVTAWLPFSQAVTIGFGAVILCLALSRGPFARLLGSTAMVYGGEISYSLYMTHAPVSLILVTLLPGVSPDASLPARGLVVAAYLGVSFLAADMTWRFVEKPCREWMRTRPFEGRLFRLAR
jgi:peptidoglycan/LPS O-acetylase OafA/YrhL